MKRLIDFFISFLSLVFLFPLFIIIGILIKVDSAGPIFFLQNRVGYKFIIFKIIKFRTMYINSEKTGKLTSYKDTRVTNFGSFLRRYKIDELPQLINVLVGEISLVGPRPNVKSEVNLYTNVEKKLLSIKPGITDFSSLVFSDEEKILKDKKDPYLAYNQLIRPWKSRLGLIYIKHSRKFNVDQKIIEVAKRDKELYPFPPPGSDKATFSYL
jgi:lipopolysaccharide/colanic/teichoic acid biosynthesis glycosyltransferase